MDLLPRNTLYAIRSTEKISRITYRVLRTTILSLRELESLTSALLSVFLTFLLARIACHEAGFFQGRAIIRIVFKQRAGDTVTHRTGLSGRPAAIDVDQNVELADGFRQFERLIDD